MNSFSRFRKTAHALACALLVTAAAAIGAAPALTPDVVWSIGDAVTYRVLRRPDQPDLTGHRRYLDLRAVVEGRLVVEVAPVAELAPTGPYDDLSDRQPFTGAGEVQVVLPGEVLVVEAHEAVRDVEVDGLVMLLRVSVEAPAPGS